MHSVLNEIISDLLRTDNVLIRIQFDGEIFMRINYYIYKYF